MSGRSVILYIAASVDGYIAKPNNDLSFLSIVAQEGEDYGYHDFIKTVDTVILGRKTYDWVLTQVPEFPHKDKETYVITRTPRERIGKASFYTGNLQELIAQLKAAKGKNIFIDGGAEVVNELLREDLIDEYYLSIIPVLLGGGTRLFNDGRPEQQLELVSVRSFEKGLTQIRYKRLRQ